ncbi:flagellar biosynthesis protein FlgJ [Sphingobium amiense]|uniref:Flagellar biosynthesis protein FlgJ n=1 Tax=Sphingobium amiense TaxID=135719 RepID=A0A494W8L9_9SPHN|nr:lytic transglycosylase domain-containing protein [Sphingobium amiense]BBD98927.1 flagellar biosynthesis protein FlgJ [Sphingobium amiense]
MQGSPGNRVTNAIAMASRRTGVDFSYLLGQAKIESSLNPTARAATSSATGLYQFIDQSWLAVVNKHGSEYGLGWAADAIKQSGGRYYVADPDLRQQILDLRKHPETASVMAAEHAADNKAYLESRLGREAQPVDLYLAHFLGVGGAAKFLSAHDANPDATAASLFPSAARANRSIFYDRSGNARSFAEIRDRFAAKLQKGSDAIGDPVQYADASLPDGAKMVQPADYVRIETQRLSDQPDVTVAPQPQTARLAYLMLATLGR